jgi:hypothetical protein
MHERPRGGPQTAGARLAEDEFAARYARARDHGPHSIKNPRPAVARPLSMVASALPPAATLDVAVYVLRMLSANTHPT